MAVKSAVLAEGHPLNFSLAMKADRIQRWRIRLPPLIYNYCQKSISDTVSSKMFLTIYRAVYQIAKLKKRSTQKGVSIYSLYTI